MYYFTISGVLTGLVTTLAISQLALAAPLQPRDEDVHINDPRVYIPPPPPSVYISNPRDEDVHINEPRMYIPPPRVHNNNPRGEDVHINEPRMYIPPPPPSVYISNPRDEDVHINEPRMYIPPPAPSVHINNPRDEDVHINNPRMYVPPPRVHINEPRMYVPPPRVHINEPRMYVPPPRVHINEPRMYINNPREATGFNGCSDSQISAIQKSAGDAAGLADWIELYMDDKNSNADKHYFNTDPNNADYYNDWSLFKSAVASLSSNDVPDSDKFVFECAATETTNPCVEDSYAVTDVSPDNSGLRVMTVCPQFFTLPVDTSSQQ
ncbi:MAG: hypothetical protein FRX48_06524 [Lasallia pustulata]|uniref:Uncharacterized protein n=1 Tax=Lasallia pustulata TaxID=136370 RepID=A0A5M8PKQ4_9LECA|nr:MAG: hypothetical protein FRX48_06524 [Lasallia pustulata]